MTGSFARRASATVTATKSRVAPGLRKPIWQPLPAQARLRTPGACRVSPEHLPSHHRLLSVSWELGQQGHLHQVPRPLLGRASGGRDGCGAAHLKAKCRARGTALTWVEAQIAGVEASDQQAGTQPDTLEMVVAPVQVHKEDVVQVQLQAGPAGTRGRHTCQVCRRQASVSSAHPLTSQPTVPSVLGLTPFPGPKPCAPRSGCPTPGHKGA